MNNSEQISRYLQDEMSGDEKAAFEAALLADTALQQEVNMQRNIMQAAVNAGIKAEFARAIHNRTAVSRSVKWGFAIAATLIIILVFNFRHTIFPSKGSFDDIRDIATMTSPFVNPPMPEINVPLAEYFFDAEKGTTIFYGSGSIISFPGSSLVDAAGIPVKGKVRVTYREFSDPLDFFVSGIPMGYDSAGRRYNFESSGMCEINAYKDDKPVFVNKNARPEIHLSSKNKSPLHNLYSLDTVNRKWNFIGKDIITEVKNTAVARTSQTTPKSETTGLPVKPVRPAKATEDKQSFSIEIEPGAFEELFSYNGLKFQVEDESTYKRSDANEHWENVKLEHTDINGLYKLTFSNSRRAVSYRVRPVLEGEDYEAALKLFNQKNTAYEQALQKRLENEKNDSDRISVADKKLVEKMKGDKEWNEKINQLIIVRNKYMREQRKLQIEAQIKARDSVQKVAAANWQMMQDQMLLIQRNKEKYAEDIRLSTEIVRTFPINNFGVWNCDHPQFPNAEIPLLAKFTNTSSDSIYLPGVSVVYAGLNGITQFQSAYIRVIPGRDNMVWSLRDGNFYYFTYKDFRTAKIRKDTKTYTFEMRKSEKPISSYNDIRELVGKL